MTLEKQVAKIALSRGLKYPGRLWIDGPGFTAIY
jgi:hypothetical protein